MGRRSRGIGSDRDPLVVHSAASAPRITGVTQITAPGQGSGAPMLTDGGRLFFNLSLRDRSGWIKPFETLLSGGDAVPLPPEAGLPVDVSPDGKDFLLHRFIDFGPDDTGATVALS